MHSMIAEFGNGFIKVIMVQKALHESATCINNVRVFQNKPFFDIVIVCLKHV